jgi:hypothetical protein
MTFVAKLRGVSWKHTFGEGVDGEFPVWVLGQVFQRDFGFALSYHEMYDDQALEDNGPCRVAQSVREGAKDLGDAGFSSMCRDQDVLDILGLWGGELQVNVRPLLAASGRLQCGHGQRNGERMPTLILVPPLTLFSKELAIGPREQRRVRNALAVRMGGEMDARGWVLRASCRWSWECVYRGMAVRSEE